MDYPNVTEDKLVILYIINKLNKSITNLQMVDLILDTTGIDYFSLQQLLLNLEEQKLIISNTQDGSRYYKITDSGKESLEFLQNLIPSFMLKRINSKIQSIQKKIQQKTVVFADYTPENENTFIVNCKIAENDLPLLELTINVPDKELAIFICNKWYENPSKIYGDIITMLSGNITSQN